VSTAVAATHEAFTPFQRALVLITVSTCTALYALTMTVVNVVLPNTNAPPTIARHINDLILS